MGRQLTTAAAAERQERNHEGLQHLTPGGGQPWHEPEGAGGERGDGHGGVWVGGDQGGQGSFITLTLTESTWSVVSTVTTDLTTVSSCVSASVSECAAARSGPQKDVS